MEVIKIEVNKTYNGDALEILKTIPDKAINCCVTSPPYYGLRDYGVEGQIGLEGTPESYIDKLVNVFREVKRVLTDDGTLWLNIADTYAGGGNGGAHYPDSTIGTKQGTNLGTIDKPNIPKGIVPTGCKPKDLIGIPWLLAFALRDDGWFLRQDIIWHKPNPMPESVRDRCTKSHEYIFLLSKSKKYYFDYEAIKEEAVTKPKKRNKASEGYQADYPNGNRFSNGERIYGADGMRNKRDVWTVATRPLKEAHFATFPPDLIEPCILSGCPKDGIVIDPFFGSGTVGLVSKDNDRNYIGIDLNSEYCKLANSRIEKAV